MRHPHADVAIAFAEGKTIQRKSPIDQKWQDWDSLVFPSFSPDDQWRVAPEPKPDIVQWGVGGKSITYWYDNLPCPAECDTLFYYRRLDGTTGRLKECFEVNEKGERI